MVELTRFTKVSEAEILANLLQSEGIDCYVRDGSMNQIYNGLDLGGVKVELLDKDLERAMEIMKAYGYTSSDDNADTQKPEESADAGNPEVTTGLDDSDNLFVSDVSEDEAAEYERKNAKLSGFMTIIIILIITVLVILILLNKFYNG